MKEITQYQSGNITISSCPDHNFCWYANSDTYKYISKQLVNCLVEIQTKCVKDDDKGCLVQILPLEYKKR